MKPYLILDRPTPLPTTPQFMNALQLEEGNPNEKAQQALAMKMGFKAVLGNWFMPWFAVAWTSHLPQSNYLNTTHAQPKYIKTEYDTPSNIYTKLNLKAYIIGEQLHAPNLNPFHCQLFSAQHTTFSEHNASHTMLSTLME
jgi:hypothetical protein